MADTIQFNADVNPAIREIDRLTKKIDDLSNSFKDKFGKMTEHAMGLATALVAAGTAVAAFADDITDIADANQVAIAEVLGLSKALEASGGKADSVGRLFQTMSNKIEETNSGNLKSLTTFNRLGVSLQDLGSLSNSELKNKLLDGLVKIRDPIERNALAMDIFGKSLVGVDIEKFAANQRQMTADAERFSPAIQTAGDAWDNVVSILGKLKLAFAEAFQPVFFLISKLSINVDLAAVAFRLLAIGIAAAVAPAILAGFASLIKLVQGLTAAAARNPFLAIATALLAIGPSVASYLGLTKEVNAEQDATNDKLKQGQRNQEGINEALKKEKDTLGQIGEQLNRNWKKTLDKYNLELQSLGVGEEQKRLAEEKAKIEQEAQDALTQLRQKYDALDAAGKARNKKSLEEESAAIEANAKKQKDAADAAIRQIEARKAANNDLIKGLGIYTNGINDVLTQENKLANSFQSDNNQRLKSESQLNELIKRRQLITESIAKLSPQEQLALTQAMNDASLVISDQIGKVDDLSHAFREAFREQYKGMGLSRQAIKAVTEDISSQTNELSKSSEQVLKAQIKISDQARSFTAGWQSAFGQYINDATNAAMKAQQIFQTLSRSLEDSLFRFFTTGKFGWKQFADDIIKEMIRIETKQLAMNILTGGKGKSGGAGSGLLGLGGLFGFLANGGPASANKPYIVGERGPELFVPNTSGTVVPNDALGGGGTVTYNINAVDAMSFKQMLAQDPTFLHAVAEQGRRRLPGGR